VTLVVELVERVAHVSLDQSLSKVFFNSRQVVVHHHVHRRRKREERSGEVAEAAAEHHAPAAHTFFTTSVLGTLLSTKILTPRLGYVCTLIVNGFFSIVLTFWASSTNELGAFYGIFALNQILGAGYRALIATGT